MASIAASSGSIVSHGGGQSNAMLALARLCDHRDVEFAYHTRPLPKWLRSSPIGNLRRALGLGMHLIEHATAAEYEQAVNDAASSSSQGSTFVPQGAAWPGAELGVKALAHEIMAWWDTQQQSDMLSIVVPAGTGTTALFLARHISIAAAPPRGIDVFAVPCVGDDDALMQQMRTLDAASGGYGIYPQVLSPPHALRVPFATPSAAIIESWRDAAATHGQLLDLVYGSIAWGTLEANKWSPSPRSSSSSSTTLYVNFGGHEGLGTSLSRYARAGLLRDGESAASALEAALEASGVALDQNDVGL